MEGKNTIIGTFLVIILGVSFLMAMTSLTTEIGLGENSGSETLIVTAETPATLDTGQGDILSTSIKTYNNSWLSFGDTAPSSYVDTIFNGTEYLPLTFTFWAKDNDFGLGTGNKAFLDNSPESMGYLFRKQNDDEIYAYIYYDSGLDTTSIEIPNDDWNFYTVNIQSNNTYISVNNGEFNSMGANFTDTTIVPSSDYMIIGAIVEGTSEGDFLMDEIRIYNSTLSATELTEIYSSGRISNSSLPSDNLRLWYSFNEANGIIIYDKSGNSKDGTLKNF
jgi:hypothetical protein